MVLLVISSSILRVRSPTAWLACLTMLCVPGD